MDGKKRRRRALAFTGGGIDTVMQLGVAHALLVSRSAPPDYVVGVSAGAINAAALAEVLQAGPPNLMPEEQAEIPYEERLPFQVDQLRSFLDTYLQLPRTVLDALFPDSLEVLARDPLKPLELPIHFDRERHARATANEAKAGLVSLLNDLFGIPVTLATATLLIRRVLGRVEANDEPRKSRRFGKKVWNESGLLTVIWTRFLETAPAIGSLLAAYVVGPNRAALRGFYGAATADRLMKQRRHLKQMGRPVFLLLQLFVMLHLFGLATLGWAAGVVVRALAMVFTSDRPRPRFRFGKAGDGRPGRISSWFRGIFPSPLTRILQYYGLADGLTNTDIVKQLLVRCFDQSYYGKVDLATLLDHALDGRTRPEAANDLHRKRLADYSAHKPGILVAPVAADVATGQLRVIDPNVPVVDALLAATAVVPFFPAVRIDPLHEATRAEAAKVLRAKWRAEKQQREQEWRERKADVERARAAGAEVPDFPALATSDVSGDAPASEGGDWYIDGANISGEAIAPLLSVLRKELVREKDDSAAVDIYSVANLPFSAGQLSAEGQKFDGVLDVVPRALQLKKLRDASVEQRLTELYTKALPEDAACHKVPGMKKTFVRANVFPLELEREVGINHRLLTGQTVDYDEVVYQTVADGCRATLEGALPQLIETVAKGAPSVKCADVMKARLDGAPPLPGSDANEGPGLSELCKRCALQRAKDPKDWQGRASLRPPKEERKSWPEWPTEAGKPLPIYVPPESPRQQITSLKGWPMMRDGIAGSERPLISLLFGGGVFRGVFHMGVTNALSEMKIHPDVVAGSSVGAIIAAMIAQVFSTPVGRKQQIAHLAATFLSIDRLVLTDRFADFVRRLTLRAAETPLALHDLDMLFRRYDTGSAADFSTRLRTIAAGIERLSYISPFELLGLARDLRLEDFPHFITEIRDDVQDFLDRGGIGDELLGSEPLVNLINHHVLSGRRALDPSRDDLFESFRDCGIFFIATATNLERGRLEILGGEQILAVEREPSLKYGLLASSAFPGVFRPRKSWEIFRRTNLMHQYIDGGVIDNLPLDAVAQFLDRASRATEGGPARRPKSKDGKGLPHLIFTASLEVDPELGGGRDADLDEVTSNCLNLSARAKTLKYNRKIDAFASTQTDLRTIHDHIRNADLLDLHVVAVKPKWLCSTFGFHPMLGFRRRKQAQNMAHGCASTFATFFKMGRMGGDYARWLEGWGVDLSDIDAATFRFLDEKGADVAVPVEKGTYRLEPGRRKNGVCWFRQTQLCPFSKGELKRNGVGDDKIEHLTQIYEHCGNASTHDSRGAK